MAKTLCELKKMRREKPEKYARLIAAPKFYCKKCGRVALQKKRLCKPQKLRSK